MGRIEDLLDQIMRKLDRIEAKVCKLETALEVGGVDATSVASPEMVGGDRLAVATPELTSEVVNMEKSVLLFTSGDFSPDKHHAVQHVGKDGMFSAVSAAIIINISKFFEVVKLTHCDDFSHCGCGVIETYVCLILNPT